MLARLPQRRLPHRPYPLSARLGHVLVGFEQRADVQGLAPPKVPVDGPVEGKLERAAVKPPGHCQRCCGRGLSCVAFGGQRAAGGHAQNGGPGAHGDRVRLFGAMWVCLRAGLPALTVAMAGCVCWMEVALRLMLLQRSAPEEPSLTSAFSGCAMTEVCIKASSINSLIALFPPSPSADHIPFPSSSASQVRHEPHNVWPTESSPFGTVDAFAIATASPLFGESHPSLRVPCLSQLFCRVAGDLIRPSEPGLQVLGPLDSSALLLTSHRRPAQSSQHNTLLFSQSRNYADSTIVKVPQMAESITEGTLKQWSKRELSCAKCCGGHHTDQLQRSATTSSRTRKLLPLRRTKYAAYTQRETKVMR